MRLPVQGRQVGIVLGRHQGGHPERRVVRFGAVQADTVVRKGDVGDVGKSPPRRMWQVAQLSAAQAACGAVASRRGGTASSRGSPGISAGIKRDRVFRLLRLVWVVTGDARSAILGLLVQHLLCLQLFHVSDDGHLFAAAVETVVGAIIGERAHRVGNRWPGGRAPKPLPGRSGWASAHVDVPSNNGRVSLAGLTMVRSSVGTLPAF